MSRLKTLGFRVAAQGERLKVAAPGSWRTGKTSTERGYDYRWQQAREQYLRDHPLCVYCARKGLVTAANTVDHIVAHRGDRDLFWDQSNWQSLCGPCHSSVKQAEEAAEG
ncbi:HNH endonuclease [Pseudomonas aeruginosa]|nr:HNH endonuclease signature motif containing protein [Pseudomonas aeruginosa]EKX0431506.1 HNH endonuclease [Pseudomonas aeruginosa]MCU8859860.1 HNH endonuclease [Pseudomonas aeruginosa]RPW72518.1 HNH endonuclease [Pseudomonas aeruginosa]RUE83550.1 HNH endonuclease [Pseudomonas aeruginosa]SPZ07216.1 HNH endonuclease [Pseudomonas aeruginosa]